MTRVYSGTAMAGAMLDAIRLRMDGRPAGVEVRADPDHPAAAAYLARLEPAAERAGIALRVTDHGAPVGPVGPPVLLLHPAPDGTDTAAMIDRLGPGRDAEGLHPLHAGLLAQGRPTLVPPTAQAALLVARALAGPLSGLRVAVVGASPVVGRPLALLLLAEGATVRVAQASTRDLPAETRETDVVVSAAGVPGLIGAAHVRPGAVVIDIGVTRAAGRLLGDADAEALEGIAAVLTHVPDGVGPVTAACLMENVARLHGL